MRTKEWIGTSLEGEQIPAWDGTAPLLLVGSGLQAEAPDACRLLQSAMTERFGPVAQLVPGDTLPNEPLVLIGLVNDHFELKKMVTKKRNLLPGYEFGDESYLLDMHPWRVLLAAARPAGVFNGVLKLLELARDAGRPHAANSALKMLGMATETGAAFLPAQSTVADYPTMAWRGLHLRAGSRESLPALTRLLTQDLPQLRINKLILEVDYHFQFRSRPEMADKSGLTVEDCRLLSRLAKQNFIQLIPELECLGQQSGSDDTPKRLLEAHPEFDETPDTPRGSMYYRCWCPRHPDVNTVVFDLMDELIDAFEAEAFHVGMDEVLHLGQCKRCRCVDTTRPGYECTDEENRANNATLYAEAVNAIHDRLVGKRKVQMLMWGDRLLDSNQTEYGMWESSDSGTAMAIDRVPRDIVVCDWHYDTSYGGETATYPSLAYFQQKGFRVWPSGWNSQEAVRMLTGCSLKLGGSSMLGYLATTWTDDARSIVDGFDGKPVAGDPDGQVKVIVGAIREGARIAWEGVPDPS